MDNLNWVNEIKKRTNNVPIRSGRSNKSKKINFDDLVFVPAQLSKRPVDYYKEKIKTETLFGKKSKKPLKISTPIIVGGMSFGALSREAKIALALASSQSGIIAKTGEGGMLKEEREKADKLIVQYSTGRFGITKEILKKADAIEIKIGQGAKSGTGGLLPRFKITPEIAKIRNISQKKDVHSPAYHQDIKNINDLKIKINQLKKQSNNVSVIVKIGAGNIEKDIEFIVGANPDVIALDGMEGGTGAASEVLLDDVGIPTIPALVRARRKLNELKSDCELWVGGGFNKGNDIAKALALGADGVYMSFSFLICMGCVYCQSCYLGKCPMGVATQDSKFRKNFNMEKSVENIVQFVNNCTEEIKMITGAVGKNDVSKLDLKDLRALTLEMSKITGVKFISESS